MKNKVLLLLLSLSSFAFADQIFQSSSGQKINATISNKELTKIQVSGVPISRWYTTANVAIQPDQSSGNIFVVPYPNQKTSFILELVDKNNDVFTLQLSPSKNSSGDGIVIIPDVSKQKTQNTAAQFNFKNQNYSRNINALVQLMYLDGGDDNNYGYDVKNLNIDAVMYKNVKTVIQKEYNNGQLTGFILYVKNNTSSDILLTETMFSMKNVLAVAIENPSIKVGQATRVFLVKESVKG